MPVFQSRSLLFLLLLGCGCLALPLGFGLQRAGGFVSGIGEEAKRLLHQGVETARRTRVVLGIAADLDRNVRQLLVLKDPALAAIYHERHRKLIEELEAIQAGNRQGPIARASHELHGLATELHRAIVDPTDAVAPLAEYLPRFETLVSRARSLETLGARRFSDDLRSLNASTDRASQALSLQGLALIPVTLAVALLFCAVVLRPIRALTGCIRRLGEGRLRGRVIIPGPREIASLGNELEWLRARLAASEEEKSGFLRRMSHELKTPLASLREGTELLADGSVGVLSRNQCEVVDIMRESASRLDAQIHNLLALTGSGASSMQAPSQRIRVDHLLTQVLRTHRLALSARQIRVDAQLADISVPFDPQGLRMALDNVVGNAVKFTPAGGAIAVWLREERRCALIDVRDSGPGIPRQERDLIFRPFFQGSAAEATPLRGAGVGLSVVRDCLRRHGGRVEILDCETGAHVRLTLKEARRAR